MTERLKRSLRKRGKPRKKQTKIYVALKLTEENSVQAQQKAEERAVAEKRAATYFQKVG